MKYQQTFTVTGFLTFPIDMLRYDQCWPYSQEDATKIQVLTDRSMGRLKKNTVTLCRWLQTKSGPSSERWNSFGWKVDEKSIRTFKGD